MHGRVAILLVASFYGKGDKLQLAGLIPVGTFIHITGFNPNWISSGVGGGFKPKHLP